MIVDNEVKVSICCTTYNHEKYIKRTLIGFLTQKTNFKYEIIIHDDASTDHTAEIIKTYEREYPDILHGIYQHENQYSKGKRITQDFIAPKTKGKYLYFAYIGNVYYIQDIMSCYRRGVSSSWSQIQSSGNIVEKKYNNVKKLAETMKLYDEYTAYRYHDICTLRRAYYLKTAWLLEGTTAKAFKSESKELLAVFPLRHEILLLIAAVFPKITKKIYTKKIISTNKKKGYQ